MALTQTWETSVSKLIAKTWLDDELLQNFVTDPAGILREAGLLSAEVEEVKVFKKLTGGSVLEVVEDGITYQIALPAKPADLSDEHIRSWAEEAADLLHAIPKCC